MENLSKSEKARSRRCTGERASAWTVRCRVSRPHPRSALVRRRPPAAGSGKAPWVSDPGCRARESRAAPDAPARLAPRPGPVNREPRPRRAHAVAEVRKLTGGVDVAIEALGTQQTFESALRCLRPGGTLSSLGVYSGKLQMPYDAFSAGLGDHRIVTTLCPGGKERKRRLMEIVRHGRVDLTPCSPTPSRSTGSPRPTSSSASGATACSRSRSGPEPTNGQARRRDPLSESRTEAHAGADSSIRRPPISRAIARSSRLRMKREPMPMRTK